MFIHIFVTLLNWLLLSRAEIQHKIQKISAWRFSLDAENSTNTTTSAQDALARRYRVSKQVCPVVAKLCAFWVEAVSSNISEEFLMHPRYLRCCRHFLWPEKQQRGAFLQQWKNYLTLYSQFRELRDNNKCIKKKSSKVICHSKQNKKNKTPHLRTSLSF